MSSSTGFSHPTNSARNGRERSSQTSCRPSYSRRSRVRQEPVRHPCQGRGKPFSNQPDSPTTRDRHSPTSFSGARRGSLPGWGMVSPSLTWQSVSLRGVHSQGGFVSPLRSTSPRPMVSPFKSSFASSLALSHSFHSLDEFMTCSRSARSGSRFLMRQVLRFRLC